MNDQLKRICEALLVADPDIEEIVQFGSSVFASDLAKDVDLLVITSNRKESEIYWNLTSNSDIEMNVDLNVHQKGERIGGDLGLGICAASILLYGDGQYLKVLRANMRIPSYQQVRSQFKLADEAFSSAQNENDEYLKDERYRMAFNRLFEIARNAAMVYLNTDQTRWGELRRSLPEPFSTHFREIIDTLHIEYGYNGSYPKDQVDAEYRRWRNRVSKFVDQLEVEATSGEA